MKSIKINVQLTLIGLLLTVFLVSCDNDDNGTTTAPSIEANFDITETTASYDNVLEQIVMTIKVAGMAGNTRPEPVGQLDGAPVLGYVFPTTLSSEDVGFGDTEGIVAMALTSHPDFDDTPLWDENNDANYLNDGNEWHSHWVLLVEDTRVEGGLSVKEFDISDTSIVLPPTNAGMPMYLDSPGFQVIESNNQIKVVFPITAVNNKTTFNFDGVTVLMRVNTSDNALPLLGVYNVYDVSSGDLSLPYTVN
ncbi:MAG: hypothetical protein L3J20_09775 [Flavobacteriaceae bacterium]|nr:hypothetical protein [Flavobacteriaceae bacterium]